MEHKKFHIHSPKTFHIEKKTFEIEIDDTTPISGIEPIEKGGVNIASREDLKYVVEPPLLEACQILFDKGITTVFSSANKRDVGGTGHIAIDFNSLSPANKEVAKRIGTAFMMHGSIPMKGITIEFPISETATVGDVSKLAFTLVSQFEDQRS